LDVFSITYGISATVVSSLVPPMDGFGGFSLPYSFGQFDEDLNDF
jgi:hypothetical protein